MRAGRIPGESLLAADATADVVSADAEGGGRNLAQALLDQVTQTRAYVAVSLKSPRISAGPDRSLSYKLLLP